MGTVLWIGLGVAIIAVVVVWLLFRGTSSQDLGSVSSHWVIAHRDRVRLI
jgi:hypothetical protein